MFLMGTTCEMRPPLRVVREGGRDAFGPSSKYQVPGPWVGKGSEPGPVDRQHGRVVKALDSKSNGLCPRRFESGWCRSRFAFCWCRGPFAANPYTFRQSLSCVHSTRVVFIPSKDKIRVRVPMDASCTSGLARLWRLLHTQEIPSSNLGLCTFFLVLVFIAASPQKLCDAGWVSPL